MSALNRFGVPTPSSARVTMDQPKPKYKYRLQFFGFNDQLKGEGPKSIIRETDTVELPKLSYQHHNMYRYDTEAGYVGRRSWGEISLSVKDSINNELAFSILGQNQKMQNYSRRIDNVSVQSRDYKFEMWIQALVGSERVYDNISLVSGILEDAIDLGTAFAEGGIEGALSADITDYFQGTLCTWVLEGCIIKDIDFGQFDYSDSNFNTLEMTIKPDNVYLRDSTGAPWYDPGFALSNIQGVINDPSIALGGLE